jgi:sugar phosphate isomerase/epimerase
MSAHPSSSTGLAAEHCRTTDVTPVTLDARALESTAPEYLRDLKRDLVADGLAPAGLELSVAFDEPCSLVTQERADRIRDHVRAAAFLGVGTVTVELTEVVDEEKARPALEACVERAHREGVALEIDGPLSLDV